MCLIAQADVNIVDTLAMRSDIHLFNSIEQLRNILARILFIRASKCHFNLQIKKRRVSLGEKNAQEKEKEMLGE